MKIHIAPDIAVPVGKLWQELQTNYKGETFHVSAPLSSTPLPLYAWVIKHSQAFGDWHNVDFVLMDEQLEGRESPFQYISRHDPASYEEFAYKHFLTPLHQKVGTSVRLIKPQLDCLEGFNQPLDLLILALGSNGNYANVMPDTSETTGWHIANLSQEFRKSHTQAGSRSYENAQFREFGMSLGPQQVLSAGQVVVVIRGEQKKELTEQLLAYKAFDPQFPLSIIYHPKVNNRVDMYIQQDVGAHV